MQTTELLTYIDSLAETYHADDITVEIKRLESDPLVTVGFLGEFSAGKSTLINSLLGQKILPAMQQPTSRSIVQIEPSDDAEEISYYRVDGSDRASITPLEFADIAFGKTPGEALLTVPSSKMLIPNMKLVDTPGTQSLEQADADLTFGFLPMLDGAILCQDINNGDLTESALNFLQRPDVNPILDRLLVVLTHGDTKPSDTAREKIRLNVVQTLCKKLPNLQNPDGHVVVTSGKKILEQGGGPWLPPFENAYKEQIIDRYRNMAERRKTMLVDDLAEDLVNYLTATASAMELKDEDLRTLEEELTVDAESINKKRQIEKKRIDEAHDKLIQSLKTICENYAINFQSITDQTAIANMSDAFIKELTTTTELIIKGYSNSFVTPSLMHTGKRIEGMISNTLKNVDFGAQLATMAAFAAIGAAASVAGNATEAVAGATTKAVGKASVKAAGKAATGVAAAKTLEKAKKLKAERVGKVLGYIGEVLHDTNPLNQVGDMVAQQIIKHQLASALPRIAIDVAGQVRKNLEDVLEVEVFSVLDHELSIAKAGMNAAMKDRRKSEKDRLAGLTELKQNIEQLEAAR